MKLTIFFFFLGLLALSTVDAGCPKMCTTLLKQVCAKNNAGVRQTFPSECAMNGANECHDKGKGWVKERDGKC